MRIVKGMVMAGVLALGMTGAGGFVGSADAALVTQLDFSSGAANWGGKQGRALDRFLDQEGTIKMGDYQSWGEIADPVRQGGKKYSLFTSDILGAPAPSASINGMHISVDLSSLFFGWKRGGELHLWNIGGEAKGLFNPDTKEFYLSWNNLFDGGKPDHKYERKHDRMRDQIGTFFLQGKVEGAPAAVAIPAAVFLYGTGLFGVGSFAWLKRRRQPAASLQDASVCH
ncbi:MAG: hypothetical protein GDA67_06075 [Nitrospira sp. CR1.3]|nr:hypothetical protein [Nitrospira sp. CR1.3]